MRIEWKKKEGDALVPIKAAREMENDLRDLSGYCDVDLNVYT
jgi:hypothetical protein